MYVSVSVVDVFFVLTYLCVRKRHPIHNITIAIATAIIMAGSSVASTAITPTPTVIVIAAPAAAPALSR